MQAASCLPGLAFQAYRPKAFRDQDFRYQEGEMRVFSYYKMCSLTTECVLLLRMLQDFRDQECEMRD